MSVSGAGADGASADTSEAEYGGGDAAFSARQAQTRIKHEILGEYGGAWAGIITRGLIGQQRRRGHKIDPEFVYLDGYAGCNRYDGDVDRPDDPEPVWGSPTIGYEAVRRVVDAAAREGLHGRTSAIVVEEKAANHAALVENLSASLPDQKVTTPTRYSPSCMGDVAAIHGDFRNHVADILDALPDEAFLLAFVDPYGPSAHIEALGPLLDRDKTDAIILFPCHDVWLRGESVNKDPADRSAVEEQNLARNDRLFGDQEWRRIAKDQTLEKEEKIDRYAELYERRLRSLARNLAVKSIKLEFSGINTPAYHLFLLTDNPDGGMRMNGILRKANIRRHVARWRDMETRAKQKKETQGLLELDLGVSHTKQPTPTYEGPSEEEVLEEVSNVLRGAGSRITWGELKAELFDTLLLTNEVTRALTKLKRDKVVDYKRLSSNQSEITILRSP